MVNNDVTVLWDLDLGIDGAFIAKLKEEGNEDGKVTILYMPHNAKLFSGPQKYDKPIDDSDVYTVTPPRTSLPGHPKQIVMLLRKDATKSIFRDALKKSQEDEIVQLRNENENLRSQIANMQQKLEIATGDQARFIEETKKINSTKELKPEEMAFGAGAGMPYFPRFN